MRFPNKLASPTVLVGMIAVIVALAGSTATAFAAKPNIVLIVCDDLSPVRITDRLALQLAVVQNACENRTPSAASRSMCGVLIAVLP